jgi:hypothetical protein
MCIECKVEFWRSDGGVLSIQGVPSWIKAPVDDGPWVKAKIIGVADGLHD